MCAGSATHRLSHRAVFDPQVVVWSVALDDTNGIIDLVDGEVVERMERASLDGYSLGVGEAALGKDVCDGGCHGCDRWLWGKKEVLTKMSCMHRPKCSYTLTRVCNGQSRLRTSRCRHAG
jgi:hypothetical protein